MKLDKYPLFILNIWDDLPAPLYNESYYDSCDMLLGISKQTENINRLVLGDKAKNKIISYVPHGINEEQFSQLMKNTNSGIIYKKQKNNYLEIKNINMLFFFNSRNIRRKMPSDLLAAYKLFKESLPEKEKDDVCLVLHTTPIDNNGTDLLPLEIYY
jgi:hypothetical protein